MNPQGLKVSSPTPTVDIDHMALQLMHDFLAFDKGRLHLRCQLRQGNHQGTSNACG